MVKSPPYTACGNAYITIYGYRIQFIGYRANSGMQSVVATWQCMSNKRPPFILVIANPEVSLGLKLDHSYGLILELSELHTCTHYPVIALWCMRPSLHAYGCTCMSMTVTSCLQSSNLTSITRLRNNTSAQFK